MRPAVLGLALLAGCVTTPAASEGPRRGCGDRSTAQPGLNDGYAVRFPVTPKYEQSRYEATTSAWGALDATMHRFKASGDGVDYALGYFTLPCLRKPVGISVEAGQKQLVGANLEDATAKNAIEILRREVVPVAGAEYAESFGGRTYDGRSVVGLACVQGDRLYLVMAALMPDERGTSLAAEFMASFVLKAP